MADSIYEDPGTVSGREPKTPDELADRREAYVRAKLQEVRGDLELARELESMTSLDRLHGREIGLYDELERLQASRLERMSAGKSEEEALDDFLVAVRRLPRHWQERMSEVLREMLAPPAIETTAEPAE